MQKFTFSLAICATALAAVSLGANSGCSRMKPTSPETTDSDAAAAAKAPYQDPATTVYTLDNGMQVLIREDHFAPVVAMQVWVEAGGADEEDFEAGVAHVHEHMLFKGTKNRGVGEIAAEIESSGGRINAWTSWNETVYHIVVASRYADTGIDVLADAVRNSSFDPTELDKELDVVMEEYKRGMDSPSRRVFYSLFETAFKEHPYRRPVIGTEESITGLDREKILDFFGRFYTPNNMTLVIVGDVDTAAMKAEIDKVFGDFETRDIDRLGRPVEPEQTALRFDEVRMEVREAHMALGFHVPGARHEDAPLLDMLAFIMGGGESSRLYRRLVAEDQIATGAGAFAYTPPDPGLFVVTASVESADVGKAYDAAVDELAMLRAKGVTAEELERARINLESDFVFRYETVQGQARELGYFLTVYDDPNYDRVYLERLNSATLADLERVADKYLHRANMNVITLLPTEDEAVLDPDGALAGAEPLDGTSKLASKKSKSAASEAGIQVHMKPAASAEVPEPQLYKLDNGVRVIVAPNPGVPVFSIRTAMLGGVLAETAADNGISNFTAEMLTRGTENRSREQLAEDIETLAASISGFSGHNSLGVAGSFLSASFDESFDLFLEVLLQPSFDPEQVEKTRRETLLAIKNREDETSRVAFDLTFKTVYPNHPYGMTTLGEKESIQALTPDALAAFYRRALNPENLVVAVVGDVDGSEVVRRLNAGLGKLTSTGEPFVLPAPADNPTGVRVATKETERHQAHVVLGYPSVTLSDPDRFALSVLDQVMSGQGGRLFYELRDKRSLAYSVTAFFTKGLAKGIFGGYIATDPANADVALHGMLEEFRKVREAPVSDQELQRAQKYLVGSRAIALQTNGAMAEDMAFNELYGMGYLNGREYADKILEVRRQDVERVAREYLNPDIRSEIAVGPPESLKLIDKP
jgi:zinc protease